MDSKWFRDYQGKLVENIIPMESIVDEGDEDMSPMDKAAYGVPLDHEEHPADSFSRGFNRPHPNGTLADIMRQRVAFSKESHANTMGEIVKMIEQRAHLGRTHLEVTVDSPYVSKIADDLRQQGFDVKIYNEAEPHSIKELYIGW